MCEVGNVVSYLDLAGLALAPERENRRDLRRADRLDGNTELSHVLFRSVPDLPLALDDVGLSVKAGSTLQLSARPNAESPRHSEFCLGLSGRSGRAPCDGQDMESLDIVSLDSHLGAGTQAGTLLAKDISANVAVCNPSMTAEEAIEAAEMAGLREDIENMPMGRSALIADAAGFPAGRSRAGGRAGAAALPGGATRALDSVRQRRVIQSIEASSATRLVIARMLSAIARRARVVVLDKGEVAEEGSFEELIACNALCYALAEREMA
jgi:ABC-type bacteriocin/lantibiotic exporter with double-glycine peptidase domain